ncbi:MAG: hypothetical protein L6Q71_05040 [Planctomycetes bacterium]|nr:hypothetical protein [Planctomycetota bacterium]
MPEFKKGIPVVIAPKEIGLQKLSIQSIPNPTPIRVTKEMRKRFEKGLGNRSV